MYTYMYNVCYDVCIYTCVYARVCACVCLYVHGHMRAVVPKQLICHLGRVLSQPSGNVLLLGASWPDRCGSVKGARFSIADSGSVTRMDIGFLKGTAIRFLIQWSLGLNKNNGSSSSGHKGAIGSTAVCMYTHTNVYIAMILGLHYRAWEEGSIFKASPGSMSIVGLLSTCIIRVWVLESESVKNRK